METPSIIGKTGGIYREGHRRSNGTQAQNKNSTKGHDTNGFLKHRFLPVVDNTPEELKDWRKVEQTFFRSLRSSCNSLNIPHPDVSQLVFPDNIRTAFSILSAAYPDLQMAVVQDDNGTTDISCYRSLNTGNVLYYLPVRPIADILADKRRKPLANLLLSVYAYLHQYAGIPYYTEGTYLGDIYAMVTEWIVDDESSYEQERYRAICSVLKRLQWQGEKIRRTITHPYQLAQWEQHMQRFKPANEWETKLYSVCMDVWNLYKDYPQRSFMDNIRCGFTLPEEEERIYPDQYLSFYWDYDETIYNMLFETVNTDLQEKSVIEEPTELIPLRHIHMHDTSGLEYEKRLLDLITRLSELL